MKRLVSALAVVGASLSVSADASPSHAQAKKKASGDLSTIEATEPATAVEDDAVNQSLERLRERNARYEAVESGVVEAGHTVVVSLERRGIDKDGKQGDVDKHETVNIELGSPSNPPGFDDQMLGMTPGTGKEFTITYPADYGVAELAGGTVD